MFNPPDVHRALHKVTPSGSRTTAKGSPAPRCHRAPEQGSFNNHQGGHVPHNGQAWAGHRTAPGAWAERAWVRARWEPGGFTFFTVFLSFSVSCRE